MNNTRSQLVTQIINFSAVVDLAITDAFNNKEENAINEEV